MHTYNLELTIDLGKAIAEVGDLLEGVNGHLATMGISEQVVVGAPMHLGTIKSLRPFTDKEITDLRMTLMEKLREQLPWLPIASCDIRCKPSQSGNQSNSK